MKILVAPLNWGLGHASRCVPFIKKWLAEGHEVVLAGDGESLLLLRKQFPQLRFIPFAPLRLRYSRRSRQVWAIVRSIPAIVLWALKDHHLLKILVRDEHFDRIVSDNRFFFYSRQVESIYITHQLHILLPKGWRWAEPIASRMHARICMRYNKVWVPDVEGTGDSFPPSATLAGRLSHLTPTELQQSGLQNKVEYIGPLSRFENYTPYRTQQVEYHTVCVISGLEPQRTLLEKEMFKRYQNSEETVLVVRGVMNVPNTRITQRKMTIVPSMDDNTLAMALINAKHIVVRSGYSTIMDLKALGVLHKAELIPTPGQCEQEYLALLHS